MDKHKLSTGHEIIVRENESDSILKLAAQKNIYSNAKIWSAVRFWISVVIMVCLTIANLVTDLYFDVDIQWVVVGYTILVLLIDNLLFSPRIKKLKELAASIQEDFDTYVYNLSRKETLVQSVDPEIIFENSRSITDIEKLKNWYEPEIRKIDNTAAVLICQRTNQSYDSRLRQKFRALIIFLSVLLFGALMVMSLVKDASFRSVLMNAVIPFVPVLQLTYTNYVANKAAMNNSEEIKSLISQLWEASKIEKRHPTDRQLRDIQDRIFLHRKDAPLLPNWFYDYHRDSQELTTRYSVEDLVSNYLK